MQHTTKHTLFSIVLLFSLISSIIFPTSVLADDTTPPPAVTAEVSPPTQEPVATGEPVLPESTLVPTEGAPLEGLLPVVATLTAPAATEPAVTEEPVTTDAQDVDLSAVVSAAAETDVTLADASGEPLSMGTVEAAETLATGDPYFTRGEVLYRFLPIGGCAAYGGVSATCFESSTPIQAALDNVKLNGLPDDKTVFVLPGTYEEQLVIETANLILMGLVGDPLIAGAAWNAPVLNGPGATPGGTSTGITINVEGVTISGFIIQNYDTAIYQPVVVGSNQINILNNTIQNNGKGIDVISEIGAPGTIINYNVFLNNTGNDVINGDPTDNNVQNLDIKNNYWGCTEGPVVVYKKFTKVKGVEVLVGWRYRYWATPTTGGPSGNGEYVDNPNPNCALLYGSDTLWNHQISNPFPNYSPYKFLIDGVQTKFETSPTPTATNTPLPTVTNTPTNTATNTPTNTATNTPTNTATNTPTNTATNTPTNTATNTPTNTATNTPTNTATNTPTNTATNTPTNTATNTPTNTATNTPTNTATNTPTNTATNTPTNTATNTPTNTATNTPTNTATNTPTNTATNTPTSTATNMPTNTATNTPTSTATNTPINTATNTSTNTATNTPTNTPAVIPTNTPRTPGIVSTPVRPSVAFTGIVPVTGGDTHAIAAGIAHTCAITPEGGVQCWGKNALGQLGDGTTTGSNVPVNVLGISGGTTIVAGGNHTCVLSGSDVWCWGQNSQGQIGDGTTVDRNTPVKVLGNVTDITAGLDYTCAIMTYGQVMCWGNNDQGQLANGTRADSTTPTLASLITGISKVDAGLNKSCGLTGAGLLRCLTGGNNQDLGGPIAGASVAAENKLDVAVNRFGPVVMALNGDGVPLVFQSGKFQEISSVKLAEDVDSGLGHICALLEDGTVKCWGSNYYGQLGRNSQVSSSDPQSVLNVSAAWQLAVGKYHACVIITSTTPGTDDIQCWGLNKDGQLGNGSYEDSLIPVFVK